MIEEKDARPREANEAGAPGRGGEELVSSGELIEHSYDGIQEYDNPLPGWWATMFVLTILFTIPYVLYYHVGEGPSGVDEHAADRGALMALRASVGGGGPATDETMLALAEDAEAVAAAQVTFVGKCAACHGEHGQGLIGPNLTDDYWIHGGKPTDIARTIVEGVPAKGMIAWGNQLTPDEVHGLVAFILTLRGTDPAGAKAPEGELVTPAAAEAGAGS